MPWPFKSEEDRYLDRCEAEVVEYFKQIQRLEAALVKYIKANFSVRARLELVGGTFYPSHWACEGQNYYGWTPEQTFQKLVELADGNTALAQEVVRRCREASSYDSDVLEKSALVTQVRKKTLSTSGGVYWRYYD
jgi:hypothetical protein